MIITKNISKMNTNHHIAFDYLKENFNKDEKNYRILDIGGGANPWAGDWITHLTDKFVEPQDKEKNSIKNIQIFELDIDDSNEWGVVLKDVKKNGKFDFVICSHTLEDISNPRITCKMINNIGNAGFISMPSKYAELSIFEYKYGLAYCGYHHHRWIYQLKNDVLVGHPKMNFHDYIEFNFDKSLSLHTEIAFLWKDEFKYEFLYPDQMLDNRLGDNRIGELFEDDDLVLQ
jgi:hypothetical protein